MRSALPPVGLPSTPKVFDRGDARTPLSIGQIRELMAAKVSDFIDCNNGEGFLLKVAQGIGKTTTSLDVVNQLYHAGEVRPVYATIRHELIDQSTPEGW
ncbi:TPA: hypothetical protein EYO57_21055 [Candidatus Poribacteria bacterium]|nr:hypothetical protein [Candidatus Poribacteria bacterium]